MGGTFKEGRVSFLRPFSRDSKKDANGGASSFLDLAGPLQRSLGLLKALPHQSAASKCLRAIFYFLAPFLRRLSFLGAIFYFFG